MIHKLIASRRSRLRSRPRTRRFVVEGLEGRELLSTVVALTEQNQLLRVDSVSPGSVLASVPISGLQAGEAVLGIDVRPATGELYGLGSTGRLYVIDATTGLATFRATLVADPTDLTSPFTGLVGIDFGVDFNPVPDRLRVVSNAEQNLRINPINGFVITDTPLAYAATDPNAGRDPTIVDVAYTNNFAGATATTLFGLDASLHLLVRQDPPNAGTLNTVGPFGVEGITSRGFDIAPGGTAFVGVAVQVPETTLYVLATLDTATGSEQGIGLIGDGSVAIRDIAVVPSVQFSTELVAVAEGAGGVTVTVTRTEGSIGTISVPFTTVDGTARAGLDYTATSGNLVFGPGETTKSFVVPVLDDGEGEEDETFTIRLGTPVGLAVVGAPGVETVRIDANDRTDRTGPRVISVSETGPTRAITGAVIRFDDSLDPSKANDPRNYTLTGIVGRRRRTRLTISSAVYDPAERTVTLTVAQPYDQTLFGALEFRVNGRRGGLTDANGNRLNARRGRRSGSDSVSQFRVLSGPSLSFSDFDGDRATLNLVGGGQLTGIVPTRGGALQTWIVDAVPFQSALNGAVSRGRRGDGIAPISELTGIETETVRVTLLRRDSAFAVRRLTFGPRATGKV